MSDSTVHPCSKIYTASKYLLIIQGKTNIVKFLFVDFFKAKTNVEKLTYTMSILLE